VEGRRRQHRQLHQRRDRVPAQAAAVYYFIVVPFNRFAAKYLAPPPAGPTPSEKLLGEIRDALKAQAAR